MTNDMREALQPCPFCGAKAELLCCGPGCWFVKCTGCHASSDDVSEERTIKLWNRRTALSAPAAQDGWDDISTAPTGVLLNLYEPHQPRADGFGFQFIGTKLDDGRWVNNLDLKEQHPTYWASCRANPGAAAPQPPASPSVPVGEPDWEGMYKDAISELNNSRDPAFERRVPTTHGVYSPITLSSSTTEAVSAEAADDDAAWQHWWTHDDGTVGMPLGTPWSVIQRGKAWAHSAFAAGIAHGRLSALEPAPAQGRDEPVSNGRSLYDLIYAHTVIKYDPAAGERCATQALASAFSCGLEAAATYHDGRAKKWRKAALKHKRPGARFSDHEEADLERAMRDEQDAAAIRALTKEGGR